MHHKTISFLSSHAVIYTSAVLSVFVFYFKDSVSFQINSFTLYPTHIYLSWIFFLLIFNIFLRYNEFEKKSFILFTALVGYILVRLVFDDYSVIGLKDTLRLIFFLTLCQFLLLNSSSSQQKVSNIVFVVVHLFLTTHLFFVLQNALSSNEFNYGIFWGNYNAKQYLGLSFFFIVPLLIQLHLEKLYKSRNIFYVILAIAVFFVFISFDRKAILSLFIFFLLISYKMRDLKFTSISFISLVFIIFLISGIIQDGFAQRTYYELKNLSSLGSGRLLIYSTFWNNVNNFNSLEIFLGRGIGADIAFSEKVWHQPMNSHLGIIHLFYNYGLLVFLLLFKFFYEVVNQLRESKILAIFFISLLLSQSYSISILYSIFSPIFILLNKKTNELNI